MIKRLAALGAILALAAAPAAAQSPPGESLLYGSVMPRWVAAQKVGGCVVRTNHKAAAHYVLAGLASTDTSTTTPKAVTEDLKNAMGNCLNGEFHSVHLEGTELRGIMAEALLKENDAALLRQARATAPRPSQRISAPSSGRPNFALFGCAVATGPERAAAMLDTVPNSVEELAAFQALAPALQACAPANGELHVKPGNVRWLVAASLYHLVQANGA